jgi:hypothetical protein
MNQNGEASESLLSNELTENQLSLEETESFFAKAFIPFIRRRSISGRNEIELILFREA